MHLRDGAVPFAYNAAAMDTSLNASDSIQASIRSAEQKASHHAAQARTHLAEEAKWHKVAANLGEALRLSTMPASDITPSMPVAAPEKRTRINWMPQIEGILKDASRQRPTRKELVRELLVRNPGALEHVAYQTVLRFVKAGAIKVHFDKCYLPNQLDVEGRPLASA